MLILKQRIRDIKRATSAPGELATDGHEALFGIYREIDEHLKAATTGSEELIDAMNEALRTCAALPAMSAREVLFKLAMWRWDAPGLDYRLDDLARHDALAYSAFLDLARSLEETSVLKPADHRHALNAGHTPDGTGNGEVVI